MRYLLILVLAGSLFSCSASKVETLQAENEALRTAVQDYKIQAEREAANAWEAEARALMAMREAEKQAEAAAAAAAAAHQALKDCKGK